MSAIDPAEIEWMLAIVEACLCEFFPQDFFRRCAFAAFGMRALLHDVGVDAVIVGGQFAALVVTPDRARMAVQGFGSGTELYPHIWAEAGDRLIDLGPHLLAFGSDYAVAPMPVVAWDMSAPLPAAIRYRAQRRLDADSPLSIDAAVNAQCDRFVAECRNRAATGSNRPALPTWIASNYASLLAAVERNDPWASSAKRFEQMAHNQPLPF